MTYAELADLIALSWWKANVREEGKGYLALPRYQDKVAEELDKLPKDIPTIEDVLIKASGLGMADFGTTLSVAFLEMDLSKLYEHQRETAWTLLAQIEAGVVDKADTDRQTELLVG